MSSVNGSFLDKNGLSYLWSNLKNKFMSKTDGTAMANALAALIDDGEKNILNLDFTSQAAYWGLAITNNGDGTITLNGTVNHDTSATYDLNYIVSSSFTPPEGYWVLSCNELKSAGIALLGSENGMDTARNNAVYMDGNTSITVRVYARHGYSASNLVIRPMLCRQEYWNVSHKWVPKK